MKDRQPIVKTGRNRGIDLLRLVAMYFVVVVHILGQGGVLLANPSNNDAAAWLLQSMAICAVDCYALISGFVGYSDLKTPYRYEKFGAFWIRVVTYSFGITLVAFVISPSSTGWKALLFSAFPVATRHYWFISAYAALFFIIPWINKLMQACSRRESTVLAAILLTIFVLYVTPANRIGDCFSLNRGYSFVWLVILYTIGAWMKKCDIPHRLKPFVWAVGMAGCVAATWGFKMLVPGELWSNLLIDYTSVTIVFVAMATVALFSRLSLRGIAERLVAWLAPAALGVYLIHVQQVIWNRYMLNAFQWMAALPQWLFPLEVLGVALCIFTGCLLIEKVRLTLFRVTGIDKRVDQVALFVRKKLAEFLAKIIGNAGDA